jgi:NTE family protein
MIPDQVLELPFFRRLGVGGRQAVRRGAVWYGVPGGHPLFLKGEPADHLYVVTSGSVGAFNETEDGRLELLGLIRPGDPVGEMALMAGEPHSASVYAVRDAEVVAIPKAAFNAMIRRSPTAMGELTRLMLARMRRTTPRSAGPRVFALISSSPSIDLGTLGRMLAAEIRANGVRATFRDNPLEADEEADLSAMEADNDYVLLGAPLNESRWTRFVLRQADRIWLMARADARPSYPIFPEDFSPLSDLRLIDVVLLHPGETGLGASAEQWRAAAGAARLFHWRPGNQSDLAMLARTISARSLGLVLSGGGARAYAHVGAVRALRDAGFTFDFLGGTSMGGIIAAGVAMGWDDAELEWRMRDAFVDSNPLSDWTLPVIALTRGKVTDRRLKRHFGDIEISDLERPFFCVSANLSAGEPHIHRTGVLRDALRASIAIPGLLPPCIQDGQVLVDGAVMTNFPAEQMRNFHRGPIVGVNVGRAGAIDANDFIDPPAFLGWVLRHGLREPPPIASLLIRSATVGVMGEEVLRTRIADLLIAPELAGIDMRDWRAYDAAVEQGYGEAVEALKELGGGPERLRRRRASLS